jgi:hypothetical protein
MRKEQEMFNSITTAVAPAKSKRTLAELIAAVALVATIGGALSTSAQAATFTDNSWANLTISCQTFGYGSARYLGVTTEARGAGIYMQTEMYINGAYAGATTWTLVPQGVSPRRAEFSVPPGTTVQIIVQFAKIVNGRWQYSPDGFFEYAHHVTNVNTIKQSQGTSCRF